MSILTRMSIWNKWVTFLVTAIFIGASVWALLTLKVEMLPSMEMPMHSVITVYGGAPPDQVVEKVTIPVEQAVVAAGNVKEINSTSMRNMSMVITQYEYGTNMKKIGEKVSENLAQLKFPEGVNKPIYYPINMDMMPVLVLSVTGDGRTLELREIADKEIVPKLSKINGVFRAQAAGGEEQAVIMLNPEKLNEAGVSTSQVVASLNDKEFTSLENLGKTNIQKSNVTGPVLNALAKLYIGQAPGTAISRTNGKPAAFVIVYKDPSANSVEVANALVAESEKIAASLSGKNIELLPVFDQSEYIEKALNDVYREALVGAILAILVIFVYLMAFRASLVTALSIPLSVLVGFLMMRITGLTINLLTLTAIAVSVGRVIDDAIVVLEVIYQYLKRGETIRDAIMKGAKEVATPITSATIATVAVFIPIAFVGGMVGELFRPFALTVTFALLASLVVSLTIVPALSIFIRPKTTESEPKATWYQRVYRPILIWSLKRRFVTLGFAAAIFAVSFALLPIIGTTFMGGGSEKTIVAMVKMPLGTSLEETSQKTDEIEKALAEVLDYKYYYSAVGTSAEVGFFATMTGIAGDHTADVNFFLKDSANLKTSTEKAKEAAKPFGDLLKVLSPEEQSEMYGGMGGNEVKITVTGNDPEKLGQAANDLLIELQKVPGLANLSSDAADVIPQAQISPNMLGMAMSGMDQNTIMQEFNLLMVGANAGTLKDNGYTYPVYIAPPFQQIKDETQLKGLLLGITNTVKLGQITNATFKPELVDVKRTNQMRAINISAVVTQKDMGAANNDVQAVIDSTPMQEGISAHIGGVFADMGESFKWMFIAIGIAIIIAYLVMVLTLRSFLNPFIIMFSLPLCTIGAFLGLLITGRPLGVSALMGLLMLVGIVLTNAIVLIAVIDQLKRSGLSTYDAIIQGGHTRLRPILMTASATMLAMLPLAIGFGEGGMITAELGTVVIGGLFTSTLLTLVVIPVIYSLFEGVRRRVGQKMANRKAGTA